MTRAALALAGAATFLFLLIVVPFGVAAVAHRIHGDARTVAPAAPTPMQRCQTAGGMFVAFPSGKTLCTTPGLFR